MPRDKTLAARVPEELRERVAAASAANCIEKLLHFRFSFSSRFHICALSLPLADGRQDVLANPPAGKGRIIGRCYLIRWGGSVVSVKTHDVLWSMSVIRPDEQMT